MTQPEHIEGIVAEIKRQISIRSTIDQHSLDYISEEIRKEINSLLTTREGEIVEIIEGMKENIVENEDPIGLLNWAIKARNQTIDDIISAIKDSTI